MPAAKLTRAQVEHVKATAIATGSLIEAARVHGIEHAHAKQLACRGKWPLGLRAQRIAADAEKQAVTAVTRASGVTVSASQQGAGAAIADSIADNRAASAAAGHVILRRSLERVQQSKRALPVKTMRDLKDAMQIAEPHGDQPSTLVQIAILG